MDPLEKQTEDFTEQEKGDDEDKKDFVSLHNDFLLFVLYLLCQGGVRRIMLLYD